MSQIHSDGEERRWNMKTSCKKKAPSSNYFQIQFHVSFLLFEGFTFQVHVQFPIKDIPPLWLFCIQLFKYYKLNDAAIVHVKLQLCRVISKETSGGPEDHEKATFFWFGRGHAFGSGGSWEILVNLTFTVCEEFTWCVQYTNEVH